MKHLKLRERWRRRQWLRRTIQSNSATVRENDTSASNHNSDFILRRRQRDSTTRDSAPASPYINSLGSSKLEQVIKVSAYFGLVPCSAIPNCSQRKPTQYWIKATFAVIITFCLLRGMTFLKSTYLEKEKNSSTVLAMSSMIATIATRASYANTFTGKSEKIQDLLKSLRENDAQQNSLFGLNIPHAELAVPASSLALSTFFAVSGVTMFKLQDWDFGRLTRLYSYEMKSFFLKWTASNESELQLIEIDKSSATGRVTTVLGFLAEILGYFIDDFTLNICILLSMLVFRRTSNFSKRMDQLFSGASVTSAEIVDVAEEYKRLQTFHRKINDAFGNMLMCCHFKNFFVYVYYLDSIITGEQHFQSILFQSNFIVKVFVVYYFGKKASDVNEELRNVIRGNDKAFVTALGGEQLNLLVDDLARKPVGLGDGSFFVDECFIGKFLTSVVSYILFLATNGRE